MRIFSGLIFLAEVDLAAPTLNQLYCVDSSLDGFCVMVSGTTEDETRDLFKWRERWRFIDEELDFREVAQSSHPDEPSTGQGWSADCSVADTAYSRWLFETAELPFPGGERIETPESVYSGASAVAES